jgi:hypothetical protein
MFDMSRRRRIVAKHAEARQNFQDPQKRQQHRAYRHDIGNALRLAPAKEAVNRGACKRKDWNEPKMVHRSVFERTYFIDVQSRAILEHGQNDSQTDSGFRGGNYHHEERIDMSVHLLELVGESDKTQVHRVKHQLDGHEDRNDILPEQKPGYAEREQNRGKDQVPTQRNGSG